MQAEFSSGLHGAGLFQCDLKNGAVWTDLSAVASGDRPNARMGSSAVHNGKLYLFGGEDGKCSTLEFDVLFSVCPSVFSKVPVARGQDSREHFARLPTAL